MLARNKQDRIAEAFSGYRRIHWKQIYFLSKLLQLEEEARNCRFFLQSCWQFEDFKKTYCLSKIEEADEQQQQLGELTVVRFVRHLVQHFVQTLTLALDCKLYDYYAICLSTLAQDGGLLLKKAMGSSREHLEMFLRSTTRLSCVFLKEEKYLLCFQSLMTISARRTIRSSFTTCSSTSESGLTVRASSRRSSNRARRNSKCPMQR